MHPSTFEEVAAVLTEQFHIDRSAVQPQTTLLALGLDSLTLMEFVFAVEDRFNLRIREDQLDPRQAGLSVADLCDALEAEMAQRTLSPLAA